MISSTDGKPKKAISECKIKNALNNGLLSKFY